MAQQQKTTVRTTLLVLGAIVLFSLGVFGFLVVRAFMAGPLDASKVNDQGQFTKSTATSTGSQGATLVTTDDPSLGPINAKVTVVEFGDFECPFCQASVATVKDLVKKNGKFMRIIFRDFPNSSIHDHAEAAALAAGCAQDQGKFWDYHDLLYINQDHLELADLRRYADQLGLNRKTFDLCLANKDHTGEVGADYADGIRLGVSGTPTWFVNGVKIEGAIPLVTFQKIITAAKHGTLTAQK